MKFNYVQVLPVLLAILCIGCISPTYITLEKPVQNHHKSNHVQATSKRYGSDFKDDWAISMYLKLYGVKMMMWRCKKAIQPFWDWKPIPVVELYCEVIGRLQSVSWEKNGKPIKIGGRYKQRIAPHYNNGKYFMRWIDFKLNIHNATNHDSGVYTFRATDPDGRTREDYIFVDISEKRKKRRKNKKRKGRFNRRFRTKGKAKGKKRSKTKRNRKNKIKSSTFQ